MTEEIIRYSTGSISLDELFGGYQDQVVMQAYGKTATGKTTITAYMPIISIYQTLSEKGKLPKNGRFIVVDGDGGFDWERMKQICDNRNVDFSDIRKRTILCNPKTFDEQHKFVEKLRQRIKTEKIKPLFITIDPVCYLYRGIVMRASDKYRAVTILKYTGKLDLQLMVLRHLAVEYDIPACVSSWTVSPISEALGSTPESPMLGGRAFAYVPKIVVELKIPEPGLPIREAVLWKHRSRLSGIKALFKLTDRGIEDLK